MITETKKSKTIQEIIDILNNYTDKKVWIKQDMVYKGIQDIEYDAHYDAVILNSQISHPENVFSVYLALNE